MRFTVQLASFLVLVNSCGRSFSAIHCVQSQIWREVTRKNQKAVIVTYGRERSARLDALELNRRSRCHAADSRCGHRARCSKRCGRQGTHRSDYRMPPPE
jgi:hypothetical protein